MIKRNLVIPALLILSLLPVTAQVKNQEPGFKREVTLYNPYKPSLQEIKKRSFLPEMNDTSKIRPEFHYNVSAEPFVPVYTISPIKAATLLPDQLPKLYKNFVNIGLGNYLTPLAEISLTNERSKKGAFGVYGRHFSTNGKLELQNGHKVFAGYMDNDASVFGKKFFRKSMFESSVDFSQKVRYAYGYDPSIGGILLEKNDTRMKYYDIGAKASLSSLTLDTDEFAYDFDLYYNYFSHTKELFQHNAGLEGIMAKSFKGLYIGSGINYEYYNYSDSIIRNPEYIFSLSPFIKKISGLMSFKLGFQALIDRSTKFHLYPNIDFGFSIVPSYLNFFAGLSGKLEKNEPLKIISENPYLANSQFPDFVQNGMLFRLPDTNHELIVSAGFKGNSGIDGNYLVSASYSIIDNMLFYSNIIFPDTVNPRAIGNYFLPIADYIELLTVHAEFSGAINDKISFNWMANFYNYNTSVDYAWNKPEWDGRLGLKYNLRDKIIAGVELTGIGKRRLIVNGDFLSRDAGYTSSIIEMPAHFNLNVTGEYRYSKILSFWTRLNNISYDRYYEWAFYPSQRFIFMFGITYSL